MSNGSSSAPAGATEEANGSTVKEDTKTESGEDDEDVEEDEEVDDVDVDSAVNLKKARS